MSNDVGSEVQPPSKFGIVDRGQSRWATAAKTRLNIGAHPGKTGSGNGNGRRCGHVIPRTKRAPTCRVRSQCSSSFRSDSGTHSGPAETDSQRELYNRWTWTSYEPQARLGHHTASVVFAQHQNVVAAVPLCAAP